MASTVLDSFSKLVRDNPSERVDGALKILQYYLKQTQENDGSKEINHLLNRLVRGLGSSKISSRKGFYITLTTLLTISPSVTVEKLFSIMDNELKTSGSNSKGEFADINNGRILACGAIIRSKILKDCSTEEQTKVLETLIYSGKQRSYLSFEAASFIVELLNLFEDKDSLLPLWPVLEKEICKPLSEQTLDTLYILLIVLNKFPKLISKKSMRQHFGNERLINEESMKDILKITTDLPRIMCYKHPIYTILCERLINSDNIEAFWLGIDQYFIRPSKTMEYLGVELLNIILEQIKNKSIIPTLISPNFFKFMLKKCSNSQRNDEVIAGFRKALAKLANAVDKELKTKLQINILKKLILHPGDLMIEKITGTKVVQLISNNLNEDGVRKLSKLYREIATNVKTKEKEDKDETEPWKNSERLYAMQLLSTKLMSHPAITHNHEWRIEQLKFLFNMGTCEIPNVGVELAPHFKDSFYRALDHKLSKLDDLRAVLSSLVSYIDETIFKSSELTLRTPLEESAKQAWNKMLQLISKLKHTSAVFHTMGMHMGLQLFSDAEFAVSSIDELNSCYERVQKQSSCSEEEPEWVEVVVDLILSLLSRKSHLLRSLIGCVFPHICPHLNTSAIHQILDVLDVKSGNNPLSSNPDNDEDEDEDEDDNGDEDEETEESNDEEEDDNNSNGENNADFDEESDSDLEESDPDDETITDKVRLAVHQALGSAANAKTDDEDMDVDDIDEEEGRRLDESLAAAFRILRENRKRRTKSQEKNAEALTHFRIRVIDLLIIYLETGPSMAVALDMLVPLFALLEFSIKDVHQKPLELRVRNCLKKLAGVKKFKNTDNINEELLSTVLKALIEKGERSAMVCQEMGDKLAQCCVFLVRCSQKTNVCSDSFVKIFGENLTVFFKKRDSILPAVLFKSLLQLCWIGNWHLASLLVDFAFDSSIRSYRRIQALDLLKIFFTNVRMLTSEDHKADRIEIEKRLCNCSASVLTEFSSAEDSENKKDASSVGIKQKYVSYLFSLLFAVHCHHLPEVWDWKKIGNCMASYRSSTSLSRDAKKAYNKLANRITIPAVSS